MIVDKLNALIKSLHTKAVVGSRKSVDGRQPQKGFTLIELLVVVGIIATLSTIGLINFQGTQGKARDSQRKTDLRNLATALEIYYQKNNRYVQGSGSCSSDTITFYSEINSPPLFYMSDTPPHDPLKPPYQDYQYCSINNGASYRLFAKLERCSNPGADPDIIPGTTCSTYNYSVVSDDLTIAYGTDFAPSPTPSTTPFPTLPPGSSPTPTPTPTPLPTPIPCSSPTTLYADADGDGYGDSSGNPGTSMSGCVTHGWVTNKTDCNDTNKYVFQSVSNLYEDHDQDGYTTTTSPLIGAQCVGTAAQFFNRTYYDDKNNNYTWAVTSLGLDCNDNDPSNSVGGPWYQDNDGDGYGSQTAPIAPGCVKPTGPPNYVTNNLDCNDSNASVTIGNLYYKDNDNDTYGTSNPDTSNMQYACTQPVGFSSSNNDCNDDPASGGQYVYRGDLNVAKDADHDGYTTTNATSNQCVGLSQVFNTRTYYRDTAGTYTWWAQASTRVDCNDTTSVAGPCKRIFISSGTYRGNLFGLSGANSKCQTMANNASLGGTWKAWLCSSGSTNVSTTKSNYAYKLVDDQTTIADNWAGLTSGTLKAAINKTETGAVISDSNVYTATDYNGSSLVYGSPAATCLDWSSYNSSYWGASGNNQYTDSRWTNNDTTASCLYTTYKLYCIEQ